MYSKGDILEAANRAKDAGHHYIIYYDSEQEDVFIGGMLTHSSNYGNAPMNNEHFNEYNSSDERYIVTYDNSFLVRAKLRKPDTWGPFAVVGRLSDAGISFLDEIIGSLEPQDFQDYCNQNGIR